MRTVGCALAFTIKYSGGMKGRNWKSILTFKGETKAVSTL